MASICSKSYAITVAPAPATAEFWDMNEAAGNRVGEIQGIVLEEDESGGGSILQIAGKIAQAAQSLNSNFQSSGLTGIPGEGVPAGADGFTLFGWLSSGFTGVASWQCTLFGAVGLWALLITDGSATGPELNLNGTTAVYPAPGAGFQFFILEFIQGSNLARLEWNRSGVFASVAGGGPGVGVAVRLYMTATCGVGATASIALDEVGLWGQLLTNAQKDFVYNGGAGRTWPFTLP